MKSVVENLNYALSIDPQIYVKEQRVIIIQKSVKGKGALDSPRTQC